MPAQQATLADFTAEWQERLNQFSPTTHQQVAQTAERYRTELATCFYATMMAHPEAAQFLSHEEVKNRLSKSMEQWVVNLYASHDTTDIQAVIAYQNRIGEVHARVSIPVHLVLRGARLLKQHLISRLNEDLPAHDAIDAGLFASTLIDLAMEIMSHAYSTSHDRHARTEENYRLFAITQNIASEKEKQRAALLDWENQLMFDIAMNVSASRLQRLRTSEFGLWFRHKGAHGFEGALETNLILDAMTRIDDTLLPLFGQQGETPLNNQQLLPDLREQSRSIAYHLDLLFEQNNELESGRDVLTRLLNRKFLSVVLNKQINYTRETGNGFAALSIDLDYFKQINDSHGHEAGDMVLQQFAALMLNKSRAGDYLFRMGGEEFLLIMVDVNEHNAIRTSQALLKLIANESFRLPQNNTTRMTASLGLALFNGHPDYQQLLRRADAAMYQAKHNGRNQLIIAAN